MGDVRIHWWRTDFGDVAADTVAQAIRTEHVSQGPLVRQFEREVANYLEVPFVVATSSGSTALLLSLMACGVGPGDEVIVPNRTWIATAHAAHLLGAKVVLCDVEVEKPVLSISDAIKKITPKTKAIMPVSMNGRACDLAYLEEQIEGSQIRIIEDAAQAFGSKSEGAFIGTKGDVGCFSLSVAKIFSSGQGGFVVTRSEDLERALRNGRTHGVEHVEDPKEWPQAGFNFRLTDMQAALAKTQLDLVPERIEHLNLIYGLYLEGLKEIPTVNVIPVDISVGEVPVYNEVLVKNRQAFMSFLEEHNIGTRAFYPNLNRAAYLDPRPSLHFPNSLPYEAYGVYLPSGPGQSVDAINTVIETIRAGAIAGKW